MDKSRRASNRSQKSFDLTFGEKRLSLLTEPGVFSHGAADEGTALLLETVQPQIKPHKTVLDLGCGAGLLGLAIAPLLTRGQAWLVDSDIRAVRLAEANRVRNGIENAHVLLSDITLDLPAMKFDLVVSNPPTHSGREVLSAFIDEAYAVLRPGGWLYLVVNRLLSVRDVMEATYGAAEQAARHRGFIVLRAQKARRVSGQAGPASR